MDLNVLYFIDQWHPDISSTKLHEILESMNVIIPVDFLDSYINVFPFLFFNL